MTITEEFLESVRRDLRLDERIDLEHKEQDFYTKSEIGSIETNPRGKLEEILYTIEKCLEPGERFLLFKQDQTELHAYRDNVSVRYGLITEEGDKLQIEKRQLLSTDLLDDKNICNLAVDVLPRLIKLMIIKYAKRVSLGDDEQRGIFVCSTQLDPPFHRRMTYSITRFQENGDQIEERCTKLNKNNKIVEQEARHFSVARMTNLWARNPYACVAIYATLKYEFARAQSTTMERKTPQLTTTS